MHQKLRLLIAFLGLVACAQDPALGDELGPPTVAIFNIEDAQIPTPTDLLLNRETQRLELPLNNTTLNPSEIEFRAYLNTLDGYPTQSIITIPFSAALDESSFANNLVLLDADARALPLSWRYDAVKNLLLGQSEALEHGTRYTVLARGYAGGLRDTLGQSVQADLLFTLAKSETNFHEEFDMLPGQNDEQKIRLAQKIMELRAELQPSFDAAEAYGWSQSSLASAQSFTTQSLRPHIRFSPEDGVIPFPNDLLLDTTSGLVDLQIDTDASDEEQAVTRAIRKYDGFSTTAAILLEATQTIKESSLNGELAFRLFSNHDGVIEEIQELEHGVLSDHKTFWFRPKRSLAPQNNYVFLAYNTITTAEGEALEAEAFAKLLTFKSPLSINGQSSLSTLSQETAERAENLRLKVDPVLTHLEGAGIERDRIIAAVPFKTATARKTFINLRQELYTEDIPSAVFDTVVKTPFQRGLSIAMPKVQTIVTGKMPILDTIDPQSTHRYEDRDGEISSTDFILTIPEAANNGPVPVVLFGHGLETTRELIYMLAGTLAKSGYAAFAIDLPYHGKRSACYMDTECYGFANCADDHLCRYDDGSLGKIRTLEAPWPESPGYPVTTGLYFVNPRDLKATRDHVLQALLDLSQSVRVLRDTDWNDSTGGYLIDTNDIVYLGMSLGGILGSMLTDIETHIDTFALNVPGAGLIDLMEESTLFGPLLDIGLEENNIERGTDRYFKFQNVARWLFTPVEPLNLALRADNNPGNKRVMIQKSKGDLVIPNSSTDRLQIHTQLPMKEYTPLISNHAFLFDPTSFEGTRAREDVIEFLNAR